MLGTFELLYKSLPSLLLPGVTFPLATTYDPALNGEPLTGFHST